MTVFQKSLKLQFKQKNEDSGMPAPRKILVLINFLFLRCYIHDKTSNFLLLHFLSLKNF